MCYPMDIESHVTMFTLLSSVSSRPYFIDLNNAPVVKLNQILKPVIGPFICLIIAAITGNITMTFFANSLPSSISESFLKCLGNLKNKMFYECYL